MTEPNFREEGYWRQAIDEASPLPWPEPDYIWSGRAEFLKCLDFAESKSTAIDYMGHSTCRVCGKENGASEFTKGLWVWPEGFKHYIEEHGVRPSRDFEAFVRESAS